MFSLVFLMLRIVFYLFSIVFAKTSLLFFLTSHLILRCELCFLRHLFSSVLTHCVVPYCVMQTTILLFMFRIMFFQIRVFRKLSHYGLVRVINHAHFFNRGQKIYVLTLEKLQDGRKQTGVLACLVNTPTKFRFIDVLQMSEIKDLQCSK